MKRAELDTYPVAYVEGLLARVAELERELEQAKADRARAAMDARNSLLEELAKLEARCKRLEEAGDAMCETYEEIGMDRFDKERIAAWRQAKEAKP